MIRPRLLILVVLDVGLASVASLAQTGADTDVFTRFKPDEIHFSRGGNQPQSVFLVGNPNRPGLYVMRVRFPPGVMTRPHTHSQDRLVTVISGTWYAGTGEKFEPDKCDAMPAGSFMRHPAGAAHYDGAKDQEAVVQVIGLGPVTTQYLESDRGK